MKFKKIIVSALGTGLTIIMSTTAFAAGWQQNDPGWRWQNDDGTWPANTWQWLDDDNDGISKCYYFDENGYLLTAATTPDGYTVNENGAWVIDGNEQTLSAGSSADRTVHDGKFNKDGVNAVAYDLLMHTREENAEKYIETDKKTYGGHYFYEKCEYRVSYNDDQSANEVFIWAYEDDSIWAEKFNSKLSDVFVDAPKKVFTTNEESGAYAEELVAKGYHAENYYGHVIITFENYKMDIFPLAGSDTMEVSLRKLQ